MFLHIRWPGRPDDRWMCTKTPVPKILRALVHLIRAMRFLSSVPCGFCPPCHAVCVLRAGFKTTRTALHGTTLIDSVSQVRQVLKRICPELKPTTQKWSS